MSIADLADVIFPGTLMSFDTIEQLFAACLVLAFVGAVFNFARGDY